MNSTTPASPQRASFTSAAAPHSLRPRTKRLISGFDDLPEDAYAGSAVLTPIATPLDSPYFSRTQSPIPSKHPSRESSVNPSFRQPPPSELGSDLASSLSGLWGRSWTSLQGLASNVLGSDARAEPIKDNPQRPRKPPSATGPRPNFPKSQWGPQVNNTLQPGGGSKQERSALVRAKKRQELLKSAEAHYTDLDRSKRRTSDEFASSSLPPGDLDDRETMVYIHHVTATDTLPGISLKFGCSMQTVKQANRLWSNDGIHSRKTLVLPVDACSIKGHRINGPNDTKLPDLLSGDISLEDPDKTPTATSSSNKPWNGTNTSSTSIHALSNPFPQTTNGVLSPTTTVKSTDDANPWRHDSWIHLTNFPAPTELARLPRSELGFFPRARRKSIPYSDLDTPSSSFDLQRTSAAAATPSVTVTEPTTTRQHRRSSSTQRFAAQMAGRAGGVGTLVGKGPSAPGPADDKLIKAINKHMPGIIPPPATSVGLLPGGDDDLAHASSGASTPTGTAMNLEQFGSAIEGWVRKMAVRAARAVEPAGTGLSPRGKAIGLSGEGAKDGDLIELSDAFELGEEDLDDEDRAAEEAERVRAGLGYGAGGITGSEERGRERGRANMTTSSGWDQQQGLARVRTGPKSKGL